MESQLAENNTFIHAGTVSRISDHTVYVSLDSNIHCDSCRAKAACGVSESKNKVIEITDPADAFAVDEPVRVVLKKSTGFKAVFWAYVFPFILVLAVLITSSLYLAEWQAGLLGLLALVPYYVVLYFMNTFFKERLKVSVIKLV